MTVISDIASLTCETLVNAAPTRAFQLFTADMGRWWPPEYRLGASVMQDVVIEPRVGGRWFERGVDGTECDWGRVVELESAALVVLSWQLTSQCRFDPDPSRASEVAVRFTSVAPGVTRVSLEHRRFERHGVDAAGVRSSVAGEQGWEGVLRRFSDHVTDAA